MYITLHNDEAIIPTYLTGTTESGLRSRRRPPRARAVLEARRASARDVKQYYTNTATRTTTTRWSEPDATRFRDARKYVRNVVRNN